MLAISRFNEAYQLLTNPEVNKKLYSHSNETNDKYKGFLYKIQDDEFHTIGYLFGTIHTAPTGFQHKLHKKIDYCLRRSNTLWVEKNIFNCQIAAGFFRSKGVLEEELNGEVENFISRETSNPSGADSFLILRANQLEKRVEGLESVDFCIKAKKSIASEKKLFFRRRSARIHGLIYLAKFYLKREQSIENEEFIKGFGFLFRAFKVIRRTFLYTADRASEAEISQKIFPLLISYKAQLNNSHSKTVTESLSEEILGFYNLVSESTMDKYEWDEKVFSTWGRGDEEAFSKINDDDEFFVELGKGEVFQRDTNFLKQILETLSQSSNTSRSFFAVGSVHLLDRHYRNLKDRLQEKGWRVVNAYED